MRYLKIRRWFLPCERRYIECKSCGLLRVLLEVLQTLESNGNVCSSFSNTQCLFSDNFKKKLTSTNNFYTAKSVAGLHLSKVSAKVRIRHFTTQVFFSSKVGTDLVTCTLHNNCTIMHMCDWRTDGHLNPEIRHRVYLAGSDKNINKYVFNILGGRQPLGHDLMTHSRLM